MRGEPRVVFLGPGGGRTAPLTKVSRCREFGATVVLDGDHIGEARERAMALVDAAGPGQLMCVV